MDNEQEPAANSFAEEFEFESAYANNSRFEPSIWDLKILFGQLCQHTGSGSMDWHTAITMPWMQAKVFAYYLSLNIAIHEMETGKIDVHPNVLPAKLNLPEDKKNDPKAIALNEFATRLHKEMFG